MKDHQHSDRGSSRPAPSPGLRVLNPGGAQDELQDPRLDLDSVKEQLSQQSGRRFWRSLDELSQSDEFRELIHREFPRQAAEWDDSVSRRGFLQLAGAGLALAGLTGCTRQPPERVVPYVRQPEEIIPGRPLYFATAATLGGYATGLLAESHMGRPTKLEGNPDHPASLGATDSKAQAETLGLYDPDRSKSVLHLGRVSTWEAMTPQLEGPLKAQEALGGEGLRILSGAVTSPTLVRQMERVRERFPKARWIQFEPAGRHGAEDGARQAFGEAVETRFDVSKAEVLLALDADFLSEGPGHLVYTKGYAAGRRFDERGAKMSRLYAVESSPSNTGAAADHRLPLSPAEIGRFALAVAEALGVAGISGAPPLGAEAQALAAAVAKDLGAHRGASLVVAGEYTPPALHAVVHAINEALGNVGATVFYTDPVTAGAAESGGQVQDLRGLVEEMEAGKVQLLLVLDANPVFSAPADLGFVEALEKVDLRVHLGLYDDETAEYCHWHVPMAHFLEGWSDARSFDGTIALVQPLIEPLYGGKTVHDVVALFSGEPGYSAYELLEKYWADAGLSGGAWRKALHDGIVAGSEAATKAVTLDPRGLSSAVAELAGFDEGASGLTLTFRPDPSIYDGRYANNGWLQEVTKPITRLTWDNALFIAPAPVEKLGLVGPAKKGALLPRQLTGEAARAAHLLSASGKMVRVTVGERSIEVPLWVVPGQAPGVLTLHLGYGRRRVGRVGEGVGFDAYPLRTSEALWQVGDVRLEPTGETYELASTQRHHNIPVESEQAEKRHLVRTATLADFLDHPEVIHEMGHAEMAKESLYPGWDYDDYAWGMAIDLNACVGCNACVVACQGENNIPVVGKDQVARGREMHWLRIDRYFAGESLDDPEIHQQPVPCMQCEQAPCETVCPVSATVHNEHGLNDMVYNRCVGTRYCSNNCPYKVRRFNFLKYNDTDDPVVAMGRNPDVTVRFRGVMEKCTYCVQRINAAKIDAKVEGRRLRDGEVKVACAQVCAADAIVFGDINDEGSKVRKMKSSPRNYALLEELGTRPRTTYLAKLKNPNPELERS